MKNFMEGLKFWRWPILGVLGIAALVWVFVGAIMADSAWMLLSIFGVPVLIALVVVGINHNMAELYLLSKKAGANSGYNYKRILRQLERERRAAVRKMWSMKNHGYGTAYYLDVIDVEKKIAKHKGIDYDRPEYLPTNRY